MSYHVFATACRPVIPTIASIDWSAVPGLRFVVLCSSKCLILCSSYVWIYAPKMSGSMQFMALYQLADTASVDVAFFLDGSNYSNNQVTAWLNSLVPCMLTSMY